MTYLGTDSLIEDPISGVRNKIYRVKVNIESLLESGLEKELLQINPEPIAELID